MAEARLAIDASGDRRPEEMGPGQARLAELGDFIRARRTLLQPQQAGLEPTARRKTPGLRREEVAAIAGISPNWYTQVELGTATAPSMQTIQAIARALQLNAADTRYALQLAGWPVLQADSLEDHEISPTFEYVILNVKGAAATAIDRYTTPRCWNALADAMFRWSSHPDEFSRNGVVLGLMDPYYRTFFSGDYEMVWRSVVGAFRRAYTTAEPTPFAKRVFDFGMQHARFRSVWQESSVAEFLTPPGPFKRHVPEVGQLSIDIIDMVPARHDGYHIRFISPRDAETRAKFEILETIGKPRRFGAPD